MQTQSPTSRKARTKLTQADKDNIVRLAANPRIKHDEIAKVVGVERSTVSKILAQYNVDKTEVDEYAGNKTDIFNGLQRKIIKAITDEEIKKASYGQKIMSLGVIEDKLHQSSGGNHGVAIQVNVRVDPSQPVNEQITISHDGSNAGSDNA